MPQKIPGEWGQSPRKAPQMGNISNRKIDKKQHGRSPIFARAKARANMGEGTLLAAHLTNPSVYLKAALDTPIDTLIRSPIYQQLSTDSPTLLFTQLG